MTTTLPELLPDSIAIVWSTDDVASRCLELDVALTLNDQREVLRRLRHFHDATIGISWEVIDVHIQAVCESRRR